MNCICQFLYDIFPNTADKVQAWTGIFGLGAAIYAYNSWKNSSKHDFIFELIESLDETWEAVSSLRNNIFTEIPETKLKEYIKDNNNYDKSKIKKESINNKLLKHASVITKIKKSALKTSVLGIDHPLRLYYWELRNYLLMFENDYKLYIMLLENEEYYIKQLESLRNSGLNQTREFENNQKELIKNTESLEVYENKLFKNPLKRDEYTIVLDNLYKEANEFASKYDM